MEAKKFEEGLEPPVHEIENAIKDVVSEVGEQSAAVPVVDDLKSSIAEAVENLVEDGAEKSPANEQFTNVKESTSSETKNLHPANAAKVATDIGASNQTKTTSKRVQEGQKWNDRNREWIDYKKNIKSDLTSQEESSDPVAIRKQVEFYFSDSNLLVDKFLFSKVEGPANLPVPISIIHSFKRMRHFQPLAAIVEALKESKVLNLVDNDSCVQRKVPLPKTVKDKPMREIEKVYEDEAMARSVYAKGFGEEKPSTQFDIEAFFADYGPTNSVRLRRAHDKMFKGSVFVEFDSEKTQKAFLALDPKPKWKGTDLDIKSKKQYCDEKVEDIREGRIQPNSNSKPWLPRGNKQKSRGDRRGGDNDDRDWRSRRDNDSKSGFGERNGGHHRGFGKSGRGDRGGNRGRGGHHKHQRKQRDEHQVPKVGTSAPDPNETQAPNSTSQPPAKSPEGTTATKTSAAAPPESTLPDAPIEKVPAPEASKKRTREIEDNGGEDARGSAKKIDRKSVSVES
ncbi:hypothetical protein MMC07_007226 [Pseudocyphellaria aurata]|nr:hypothetical protein [Pseudocyphellaria aurata]